MLANPPKTLFRSSAIGRTMGLPISKRAIFLSFDGVLHASGSSMMPAPGSPKPGPKHFEWAYDLLHLVEHEADLPLVVLSRWRILHDARGLRAYLPHHLAARVVGVGDPKLSKRDALLAAACEMGLSSHAALDAEPGAFEVGFPGLITCDPATGIRGLPAQASLAAWIESSRDPA